MSRSRQFRKRPVTIEAMRFHEQRLGETIRDFERAAVEIAAWCGGEFHFEATYGINIPTLEGVMRASPGDWIIKGVKGEFYPCRDDIFQQTYEGVGDDGHAG